MWNKRIAALLLTLATVAATGCQKTDPVLDKKDPVSITLWHYYNGAQKETLDNMIQEFNETEGAETGIVVAAYNQGNVNELMERVLESAQKKVGSDPVPNMFAAYADTAYEIDKMGLVADIGQYLSQ